MNSTGKMNRHGREQELHRQLHGLLLGPLAALESQLAGLHPQHLGDGHAVLLGLAAPR